MPRSRRFLVLNLVVALLVPSLACAAGVQAVFDLSSPAKGPFPSDRFAVPDASHNTGLRVNLPKPNCASRPSDCADLDVINTLDGFNVQPRLGIPFTGAIDLATVNSSSVFLVKLGDTLGGPGGGVVGINQVIWDPGTQTLFAESDALLEQHTRYALVVTTGVRDLAGDPVEVGAFATFRHDLNFGQTKDPILKAYRKSLLDALHDVGVPESQIVAMSVFSTQSTTSVLEKIRGQIKAQTPAAADFNLNPVSVTPTIFPVSTVTGISWNQQRSTVLPLTTVTVPFSALTTLPGVGTLAFGRYSSPDYETAGKFIPAFGTKTGVPVVQGTNTVYFNLFLPAAPVPLTGWPVAIFGHGFGDSKNNSPFVVASSMAQHGIATIAIDVVGHGRGPASTLTVNRSVANGGPVTFLAGGRGIDQNVDTVIDSTEGSSAAPPQGIISSRDGLRQTVVDLMQLTRLIETGGIPGLDPTRIYYFGQSFGGIYGTKFLAVEPSVRVGVVNVPGGPIADITRLSPVFRPLLAGALFLRTPSLLNAVTGLPPFFGGPPLFGFVDNVPLRDVAPVTNTVPGTLEIQTFLEHSEWVTQSGNPVAYAPHIRKEPLAGVPAKFVIVQFAKGDQTVPNPTSSAILRAGDLEDRATFFRYDLAFGANPAVVYGIPPTKNPHTFLTSIGAVATAHIALAAQHQIGTFFASEVVPGMIPLVVDPDTLGPFFPIPVFPIPVFETPIVLPLPEGTNFIP
jgi:hypothetical protein